MTPTVAQQLATQTRNLTFNELPPEAVQQAKRCLLDTLGIGFGGYSSEPSTILQDVIKEANDTREATVWGSGLKTSCLYAALANGLMVRYLNNMDTGFLSPESPSPAGHNDESIPAILAVSERVHASGRDVIAAIVLAYEMLNKFFDALGGNNELLDKSGWAHETMRTPCTMALVASKLMGSTEEQMANALALAGCFNFELGVLNGGKVELTMARSLRFPYGAYGGILGAVLARKGFKGPLDVFEGHHGLAEVLTSGAIDLDKLQQPIKNWTILNTRIRTLAIGGHMHGIIEAALMLAKKHAIRSEDITTVRIKTNSHAQRILANPQARSRPKNKETADHSVYYCAAIAILDKTVGPAQFTPERLEDPRVHALMGKILVETEPRLEAFRNPGFVEITTSQGERHTCEVLHPKGNPKNPLTDADVEEKFRSYSKRSMDEKQMQHIIDTVSGLERLDDVSSLMKLLIFPEQHKPN